MSPSALPAATPSRRRHGPRETLAARSATLRRKRAPLVAASLLAVSLAPSGATAQESPAEVLARAYTAARDECDLACCTSLAALHTDRHRRLIHDTALAVARADPRPDRYIRHFTGGLVETLAEAESLTPSGFLARKLCRRDDRPWRFTRFEVLREERLGPDRAELVVVKSGARRAPDLSERDIYRFRRVDGGWKIDF